ncbi:MAG: rhamnulose-1-phosphate aldolase [Bacteroidales bacterium]|jgi:rhamnulose-1-phosphate aldolase|nr:rhamnulose-1-phosphate aldolase [Bacteroidales bacterium]
MQLNKTNQGAQGVAAGIAEVASLLWQKGWAEASGGNISVNVTEFYPNVRIDFRTYPMIPLPVKYPAIAHNYIFITSKGSRMRTLAKDPGSGICLVKISKSGEAYQVLFEDPENPLVPSSELPSHFAIHNLLVKQKREEKAVVHAHVHEMVAMSHISGFNNEARLNELLMGMHTETAYFIPEGMGYVPLLEPGSQELAKATLKSLKDHKVILWERHGCLATGKDVDEAFDRIDLVAKAAKIYLLASHNRHIPS